ncbi:MAG TPA: hypothetical protein VFT04_00575 [Gemmatimonadales bacterium]|nr:hypothetical protein [Gemmatimonadales bacterium]
MSISDDRRAVTALWIVTALITLLFGGFVSVAIVEEPLAALFGLAGLLVGALIVGCLQVTRRRPEPGTPREDRVMEAIAERLESLEGERGRVMELEERLDFAERLLARGRSEHKLEREPS